MSLKGKIAIAGVAESDLGLTRGLSSVDLMGQAALRALDDAGLSLKEVDGLFTSSSHYFMPTLNLAEYLGIAPRYTDSTSLGGASFVSYVGHAAAAISLGLCDVALIAYGSTQLSDGGKLASMAEVPPFEAPFGNLPAIGASALVARRHMHEFGTTPEQLSEVAVAARAWAAMNPNAFKREPITVADVLASPMIADPLHLLDCCLVTDGGGAVVLTSAERARDCRKQPVYVLGTGETGLHRTIIGKADLMWSGARLSGQAAYEMAGLGSKDMDFAQVYDAFSIYTLIFLEDLGFCPKGEGGPFVAGGRIAPGGELPVNTNGGGLSYCHPGMFGIFTLIEAVRQLRGECGDRQVAGARAGLCHGNGGTMYSHATAILANELI